MNTHLENLIQKEKMLESFRGKVEGIDGDVAYVTLVDSKGQKVFADCDAAKLTSQGMAEGTDFRLTIKEQNGKTVMTFEPIPRRRLSDEKWRRLHQETLEMLGDDNPTDDY
ncbi:hypothetical protein HYR99_03345 [Candidatus Poribacteria bacterium]|nr:hypothetical protein [Candidatus Poribacteria bacterium]